MTMVSDQPPCFYARVFTYRDNHRGDESPADFEEKRRGKAQHHLNISEVVPVTCDKNKTLKVNIKV